MIYLNIMAYLAEIPHVLLDRILSAVIYCIYELITNIGIEDCFQTIYYLQLRWSIMIHLVGSLLEPLRLVDLIFHNVTVMYHYLYVCVVSNMHVVLSRNLHAVYLLVKV